MQRFSFAFRVTVAVVGVQLEAIQYEILIRPVVSCFLQNMFDWREVSSVRPHQEVTA